MCKEQKEVNEELEEAQKFLDDHIEIVFITDKREEDLDD